MERRNDDGSGENALARNRPSLEKGEARNRPSLEKGEITYGGEGRLELSHKSRRALSEVPERRSPALSAHLETSLRHVMLPRDGGSDGAAGGASSPDDKGDEEGAPLPNSPSSSSHHLSAIVSQLRALGLDCAADAAAAEAEAKGLLSVVAPAAEAAPSSPGRAAGGSGTGGGMRAMVSSATATTTNINVAPRPPAALFAPLPPPPPPPPPRQSIVGAWSGEPGGPALGRRRSFDAPQNFSGRRSLDGPPVGAGLFGFGGALSRQYDAPLGGPGGVDGRFESRDGSWTADEQRLQRLGENHDVAQRQQGKKQRGQNRLRAADYKINIFSTSGRRRK